MCGRFSLAQSVEAILKRFDASFAGEEWQPRFNMAPAQQLLTVVSGKGGKRELTPMVWGLIPSWAKDRKVGYKMINARAETLDEKPSFRKPFKKQRCLVPADGFFEWKHEGEEKVPLRVCLRDQGLFAMAGLWEVWKDPEKDVDLHSFTIITTQANSLIGKIHDRMPAILLPEEEEIWLDPAIEEPERLFPLLHPYPPEKMTLFQVSSKVNSWKNDVEECIVPLKSEV